jgi:hypothetical protein
MGLLTWILLGVIVLVAIGLGVGVFFNGLFRGAEIIGENPAVQNASEEARDFIEDRVDGALMIVTTDSPSYQRGDAVLITVKNNDDETKTFPDASLGLQVKNVESDQSYPLLSAQVITELGPGESKTVTWKDSSAPAGDYEATVTTTTGDSAKTSFELRG